MGMSGKERMRKCRANRIADNLCVRCGDNKPWKNGQMCRDCLNKHNEWYKQSDYKVRHAKQRAEEKKQVIDHYGGRCTCCGEGEPCFLAIDHINGNGNSHRKAINKWGSGFFKWLIKNDFPKEFQILCHNCNMGKHLNCGICPHKARISQGICR